MASFPLDSAELEAGQFIVGGVAAAFTLLAVATPYVLGWARRPSLEIQIGPKNEGEREWGRFAFVHVNVVNKPLGSLFGLVERREVASNCRVQMVFEGDNFKLGPIEGRWSTTPEPIRVDAGGGFVDPSLIPIGHRWTLAPDEGGADLAVAVKTQGQQECFAFNGWSYLHPRWCNQEWRIPRGTYRVRVTASSAGASVERTLTLVNESESLDGFRITGDS
jgi:hypothetical protein